MDPALLNYMQTIEAQQQQQQPQQGQSQQPQEQQQMQPQEGNSPFMSGANAAIQAAKQSLGMNAEEKNRAQGLAIMNFFTNLSKGGFGPGFNGRLAGITQSLNPAVQAYMQEQNNVAALNSQLGEQYQKQQEHQQTMQQKMMEHQAAQAHREAQLNETRRSHESLEQHRSEKLGQMHGFHQEQLALKRAGLALKNGAKTQQKTGKISPQILVKLKEDLKKLDGVQQELDAYNAAEGLLKNEESPLYSPASQAAFSVIGGRPAALKSAAQADFEAIENEIRRGKHKRAFGGRGTQLEYEKIKTIDPKLPKEANLALIAREKNTLNALVSKKEKLDELFAMLASGENVDLEDFSYYLGSSHPSSQDTQREVSQAQAPVGGNEQWIPMRNSSGQPEEVHPDDVAKAESMGYMRL